jgi:hypothetical protein
MIAASCGRVHPQGSSLPCWDDSIDQVQVYLFNLQHNTARIGMQQRTQLTLYKESAKTATREIERLRHENAILRSGARPLLE